VSDVEQEQTEPGTEPGETPTGPETDEELAEAAAADEGEQEEPSDAEPQDAADTAEPEQAPIRTEKELEKAYKAIAKLREQNAARLGTIMGDDALALVECPLCSHFAPGFMFPPDVAPIPDENAKIVKGLLGVPEPRASKRAPGVIRCDQCDGNGWCLTDSLVPNYTETQCSKCAGKGWTGAQPVTGLNGEQVQPAAVTGPTVYPPASTEDDPVVAGLKAKGYLVVAPANVGG
jgi:hypothetical protein